MGRVDDRKMEGTKRRGEADARKTISVLLPGGSWPKQGWSWRHMFWLTPWAPKVVMCSAFTGQNPAKPFCQNIHDSPKAILVWCQEGFLCFLFIAPLVHQLRTFMACPKSSSSNQDDVLLLRSLVRRAYSTIYFVRIFIAHPKSSNQEDYIQGLWPNGGHVFSSIHCWPKAPATLFARTFTTQPNPSSSNQDDCVLLPGRAPAQQWSRVQSIVLPVQDIHDSA